jgi:hypothetical protein
MESISFSLPDQKNYDKAYGLALKLAGEQLSGLPDLEAQCRKSGSSYILCGTSHLITLEYLHRTYQIALPEIKICLKDDSADSDLKNKILILHYLLRAKGTPISHKAIAYQELSEGSVYFPSFFQRAVKPLINHFGKSPERLIELSKALGGVQTDIGDAAVTIPAFSRVPVTLVLWKGDEEFPPNANILFDSTILDYLSAEDINVLCQTITWSLVKTGQG